MNRFLLVFLFPLFVFGQTELDQIPDYFKQKKFSLAQQKTQEYLSKHPNSLKATELLGDAFGHQKQWDNSS